MSLAMETWYRSDTSSGSDGGSDEDDVNDNDSGGYDSDDDGGYIWRSILDEETMEWMIPSLTRLPSDAAAASAAAPPQMIKIKVRCPHDKKPGDYFRTKNPHDPSEDIEVKVPPGTKPNSFFPWVVRPVEAKKKKKRKSVRCGICDRVYHRFPYNMIVPIDTCEHRACIVCFQEKVLGKFCPKCGVPHPVVSSLKHLPFLQDLQAPEEIRAALYREYRLDCQAEMLKGAGLQDELKQASEEATKLVSQHYRRLSLKVHPDKHGEAFRGQYHTLTKARDVLVSPQLRKKYVNDMLAVVCKFDRSYFAESHERWIELNNPDAVRDDRRKTKGKTKGESGKKEKQLLLEGGVLHTRPKKARVSVLKSEDRLVEVGLPVGDEHRFLSCCEEAVVVGCRGMFSYFRPRTRDRKNNI